MLRRSPVNDRAGVTLSFSGFFLLFAGLTLTCMGWLYYTRNGNRFDWSQVLGPVLMGVGVIFLVLAAWRLRALLFCRSRSQQEQEEDEMRRRFEAFGSLVANFQSTGTSMDVRSDLAVQPPPPYDPDSAPPAYTGGGFVNRACEEEQEPRYAVVVPGGGRVVEATGSESGRQSDPSKESTFPVMPPSYEEAIAETALRPLPSLPALPSPADLPSQPGPESENSSPALATSPAETDADKPDVSAGPPQTQESRPRDV